MVNPSVAMENVNAVLFGGGAVASVNTVIRAVIPLAREHKQTLCGSGERDQYTLGKSGYFTHTESSLTMHSIHTTYLLEVVWKQAILEISLYCVILYTD